MHNATDTGAPAPLSPTYRALKYLAIAMGVILLGGLLTLFAFMARQVKTGKPACAPLTITLPAGETLLKAEEKEKSVDVWGRDGQGALTLRRYDVCSGRLLRDVRITGTDR